MGDVHHCSSAPVSEMTYTVSSGTLNSTIPYHTHLLCVQLTQYRRINAVVNLPSHRTLPVPSATQTEQVTALSKVSYVFHIADYPSTSMTVQPSADSGLVRIDPLHYLAECRKRQLNQALSVLSLSLGFSEYVCCAVN